MTGDYHTHTIFSHGKGTIEDNVKVAYEKGLQEIAITDHGFRHGLYGVMRKEVPVMLRQIDKLKEAYPIRILFGVEANLISRNGDIDLKKEDEEKLDILLMGFHKCVYAKSLKDRFCFFIPNFFGQIFGYSKKRIEKNTQAYLKAIEKQNIDVIVHLGYGMKVDAVKVAQYCKEHNVYLELNGKRILFSKEEMQKIIQTKVKFIINSDAHSPHRVGESPLGITYALKYQIPLSQIANLDQIPTFKNHRKKI